MQYIIIEKFKKGKAKELYQRFDDKGRMMPEGLYYAQSWVTTDLNTCYQVMETSSIELINEWIKNWEDLADFEIVPVISSGEAKNEILNNN